MEDEAPQLDEEVGAESEIVIWLPEHVPSNTAASWDILILDQILTGASRGDRREDHSENGLFDLSDAPPLHSKIRKETPEVQQRTYFGSNLRLHVLRQNRTHQNYRAKITNALSPHIKEHEHLAIGIALWEQSPATHNRVGDAGDHGNLKAVAREHGEHLCLLAESKDSEVGLDSRLSLLLNSRNAGVHRQQVYDDLHIGVDSGQNLLELILDQLFEFHGCERYSNLCFRLICHGSQN